MSSQRSRLLIALVVLASLGASPHGGTQPASPPLREGYAGDAACAGCHREQSTDYLQTAHHLTSQLPSTNSIRGSFAPGSDTLTILPPGGDQPALFFQMTAKHDLFSETVFTGFAPHMLQQTQRIDLVTGSGRRGQSFLYWEGDRLYELPVSFWTDGKRWINSPGFTDGTADFSRPVNPGCVECHMTYLAPLSPDPATNRFDRASAVVGISCETCHGPGAAHVALEGDGRKHPFGQSLILNPKHLTRDLQVDLCALCHNGIQRTALAPAFSYRPGKPLTAFFEPMPLSATERPDVHGNQVGLLQRSQCFLNSPGMNCSTCHEVHTPGATAASYSAKCLGCHTWQSCGASKTLGSKIVSNCIDCHMPLQQTTAIVSVTAGEEVRARMRTHWIKVYGEVEGPGKIR